MNADQQLRIIIGDYVVKLAVLMAERDELAAKLAALEAEKVKEPAGG